MRNGTQEELDAAREDATLLPFDAVFKVSATGEYGDNPKHAEFIGITTGVRVFRCEGFDDETSVGFVPVGFDHADGVLRTHMDANDLEVVDA